MFREALMLDWSVAPSPLHDVKCWWEVEAALDAKLFFFRKNERNGMQSISLAYSLILLANMLPFHLAEVSDRQ